MTLNKHTHCEKYKVGRDPEISLLPFITTEINADLHLHDLREGGFSE